MKLTKNFFFATVIVSLIMTACNNSSEEKKDTPVTETTSKTGITRSDFGNVDNKPVYLYTLTNAKGDQVKITNYGGIVTSWVSPDKKGNRTSIVLGFDSLRNYLAGHPYFGALVGRYGNRIAKGKFKIGDNTYTLATNNGANHLHGGIKGFDKQVWDATVANDAVPELSLSYTSKDMEEGYPGNLKVNVTYTLTDDDGLQIEYNAETDKPTVLNLTNHSYFNLTGDPSNSILDHEMMINANYYTPVDTGLITTGELKAVKGTPFDFNTPEKIGSRIAQVGGNPGGYDHNFVLNRTDSSLQLAVTVTDSVSGRKLQVFTTQPGVQFYTGNFLDGSIKGSDGKPFNKNCAFCLETQHFPDSPNQPKFPTTLLKPGEKYHSVTMYKLSVE
ncbi:MAG: galactose mutarotase [Bacteroidetes bacterium]|nr:galactose mutarotase [Bacteroidota bacterium]